jgi:hypothetical protein
LGDELDGGVLEGGDVAEAVDPRVDLGRREPGDPVGAELLDVERGQRRPVRHRLSQHVVGQAVLHMPCNIAQEPARERVTRARGIDHGLERERREREVGVGRDHHRAVLALLGDDDARPQELHVARGRDQVRPAGELAQLGVVQEHAVDAPDHLHELVARARDPEVHRVERDEAGRGAALAHGKLERRLDVRQEEHVAGLGGGRELGLEVGEHAELGGVGVALVQVPAVLAVPEEGAPARDALDVGDVRAARAQHVDLLLAEVVSNRPHHGDRVEERRREREVGRGASEHALALAKRALDPIERDRADDREAPH